MGDPGRGGAGDGGGDLPGVRALSVGDPAARQLDGLVANTMRSVQALEGKLTPDEQQRILDSIERAKKARGESNLDELRGRLSEMEKAAGIIGQAMLRP